MIRKPGNTDRVRQAVSGRPGPAGPTSKKGARPTSLDADDLSRRLLIVQAEQKRAQVERKRKEKAGHGDRPVAEHVESERGPLKEKKGQPQVAPPKTLSKKKNDHAPVGRPSNESSKSTKEHPRWASTGENEPPVSTAPQPYVPREAAAQFHRTATSIGMLEGPLAHRLSRQALKASFERKSNPQQPPQLPPRDGLRRSTSQRDSRILDRPLARPPRILEEELEDSGEATLASATAKTQLGPGLQHEQKSGAGASNGAGWRMGHRKRPSSTGDLADRMERHELRQQLLNRQSMLVIEPGDGRLLERQEVGDDAIDPVYADEHRVDWTQSDEKDQESVEQKHGDKHSAVGGPAPGLSKRRKSIWGLRMKFGQHGKQGGPATGIGKEKQSEVPLEPLSPKSPKARFFGD